MTLSVSIVKPRRDRTCRVCGKTIPRGTEVRSFRHGATRKTSYECLKHEYPRESMLKNT